MISDEMEKLIADHHEETLFLQQARDRWLPGDVRRVGAVQDHINARDALVASIEKLETEKHQAQMALNEMEIQFAKVSAQRDNWMEDGKLGALVKRYIAEVKPIYITLGNDTCVGDSVFSLTYFLKGALKNAN